MLLKSINLVSVDKAFCLFQRFRVEQYNLNFKHEWMKEFSHYMVFWRKQSKIFTNNAALPYQFQ